MDFRVVIPARYDSSRLPGKPLAEIDGKPMLWHVHQVAVGSGASEVIIATDDERIAEAVSAFGGEVCLTASTHRSGTERLAEVIATKRWHHDDIVVNLQGDEPLMPPSLLRQVAQNLDKHGKAQVATLCTRIHTAAELFDPHVVKVISDRQGYALYFSRAVIPWDREAFSISTEQLPGDAEHYRHLGLYAYRAGFVGEYLHMEHCALERMEALEQLRVLWHGGHIHVAEACDQPGPGVDTPEDLDAVRVLFAVRGNG